MKTALVCIAKDEDRYIGEWLSYHLKLGFSNAFVYQNNWRYAGDITPYGDSVKWIEFDGQSMQLNAYNDFIKNRAVGFDFAAFFDCDEFLRLPAGISINTFLQRFSKVYGIAVNWRLFGDSGLAAPENGDYSCLRRFVRCQSALNRHVKTILNLPMCAGRAQFFNPHCVDISFQDAIADASFTRFVHGPWNDNPADCGVWLNHYFCKTLKEYREVKMPRGKADTPENHPAYFRKLEEFSMHNFNEVEDTVARDLYFSERA